MSDIKNAYTPEQLAAAYTYEPETGKLYHKVSQDDNTRRRLFADQEAFQSRANGYATSSYKGRNLKAHRVAWAIHYGAHPDGWIDHINGVRDDNRIQNLRGVDMAESSRNRRTPSNNKSGAVGVCWLPDKRKWKAYISVSGTKIVLGAFKEKQAAIAARKDAEKQHGYHSNHGRNPEVQYA